MRTRRSVIVAAALTLVASVLVVGLAPSAAMAAGCPIPGVVSDFNGDGTSDLAISEIGAERMHILYGQYGRLTADSPDDLLINGPGGSSWYGATTVTGDFNHDGCGDLAVGDYGNGFGRVTVYYGSPTGLKTTGTTTLTGPDAQEFGTSMAVGDFNDDGRDDLVVGAPAVDSIYVFLGTASGISTTAHTYSEGVNGVPGSAARGAGSDEFGEPLVAGDFNGDGHDDVAIGVPYAAGEAGRVYVLNGGTTSAPLTTTGAQTWSQNSTGVPGTADSGDFFGWSLAAADFKGDGRTDLAVGVPGETFGGVSGAGVVDVLYSGGTGGLTGTGAQQIDQSNSGMPTAPQAGGWFGEVLCAADFNGDTDVDLAISEGYGTVNGLASAGYVTVVSGADEGLSTEFAQMFSQATPGVPGTPEANEDFGGQLAAVQVTNVNVFDLVVATPYEDFPNGPEAAGMVELLPGNPGSGLSGDNSEQWNDGAAGVKGAQCSECWFGLGLGWSNSSEQI